MESINSKGMITIGKYSSIFFAVVLVNVGLFFLISALFGGGGGSDEFVFIFGILLSLLASFIITQLFYIIALLKKRK